MKNFIKSLIFFTCLIFRKKEIDIVFSYNYSFNNNGLHPKLIEPLIEFCNNNRISYIIFEDVDLLIQKESYRLNQDSIPMTFITIIESILTKIFIFFNPSLRPDPNQFIGKSSIHNKVAKISSIFARRIITKSIITLVSNRSSFWRYSHKTSQIFDYQHGIIFDGDMNYLIDGFPPKYRVELDIKLLTQSKFIKDLIISRDKSGFYSNKNILSIGRFIDNKKIYSSPGGNEIKILFSAQNTPDGKTQDLEIYHQKLSRFFSEINSFCEFNNVRIFFKDHPRALAGQDISYLDYNFITKIGNSDIYESLQDMDWHMTLNSTSSIEAAEVGVPTIFLELENPADGEFPNLASKFIFKDQYFYPFKTHFVENPSSFCALIQDYIDNDRSLGRDELHDWFHVLVEKFDSEEFARALRL